MVYTLDWLRSEAENLMGSWNGEDNVFYHEGEKYTEDDVHGAEELLKKLDEVESLAKELRL